MSRAAATHSAVGPQARADSRRWWALAALALSLLVVGLDGSVLNVALTDIARSMGATTSDLQWVVNGYALTSASLLVPAGAMGDRLGRRRVLAGGLTVLFLASAGAAFSSSAGALIVARTVMGVGAAAVFPLALSIIPTVFPAGERAKAVAAVTAAMGVGMPLGPILGGWLLDRFWWGSTLLINLPVIAVALLAIRLVVPESKASNDSRLDPAGLVLTVAALASLVYGIVQGPVDGWAASNVVAALVGAAVLGVGLGGVERRASSPVFDPVLLRRRDFALPTLAMSLISLVMMGLLFALPMYLQVVRGYTALHTGLALTPLMLALMAGSVAAPGLLKAVGLRVCVVLGLLFSGLGLWPIVTLSVQSGYPRLLVPLIAVGAGFGLVMTPLTDVVLGSLVDGREGTGMALNLSVKQTGGVLGVAILGTVLTSAYRQGVDSMAGSLPPALASDVRGSVAGAHMVAASLDRTAGAAVQGAADAAFVQGLQQLSLVATIVALATAAILSVGLDARRPISVRDPKQATPQ